MIRLSISKVRGGRVVALFAKWRHQSLLSFRMGEVTGKESSVRALDGSRASEWLGRQERAEPVRRSLEEIVSDIRRAVARRIEIQREMAAERWARLETEAMLPNTNNLTRW